jgi:hypothetical protein
MRNAHDTRVSLQHTQQQRVKGVDAAKMLPGALAAYQAWLVRNQVLRPWRDAAYSSSSSTKNKKP